MRGLRGRAGRAPRIAWGASGRNGGFVGAGFAQRSGALIERLGLGPCPPALRPVAARRRHRARRARRRWGDPTSCMGSRKLTVSRTDQGAGLRRAHARAGREARRQLRALGDRRGARRAGDRALPPGAPRSAVASISIRSTSRWRWPPTSNAAAAQIFEAHRGAISLERRGTAGSVRTADGRGHGAPCRAGGQRRSRPRPAAHARAVLPVATYVAVTAKLGPQLGEAIRWAGAISDTRRAGDYYRVVDGDRLLWGGRITTDTREPPRLRDMMRGDILSVYPQLGDMRIEYAWPGIMGYAPHKMPQVGEIEPGLWVCSAFGGHGVAQTAAGADAVAAGIAGEDDRWRCSRRSARAGPAARWAASARSSSIGGCRPATGGTRSARPGTRRRCGHEQARRSAIRRGGARTRASSPASGAYLDDLRFDGLAHAVVLRSPHAHARIRSIDTTAAQRAPGVLAVLTAADAAADGLKPLRPYAEANVQTGEPFAFAPQPLLADDKVRFAGEPVALIVAESARPGARRRRAGRGRLRAAARRHVGRRRARRRRAADLPTKCRAMSASTGGPATPRAPMPPSPGPPTSSRSTLDNHRIVMNPMEPRGGVGAVRSGERPLHAARLQPEHPHQPQPCRPRARRRAQGRALHRARCRRRLRRQELRLCRARAGPVGGQAHRPAGEMDRQPQRGVPDRPRRARHAGRGRRWRSMPTGRFLALKVASVANLGAYMVGAGGGGADLPVHPPAGHGVSHPRDRAARRGGAEQHRADRRDARAGLRRDREHPGTADRRGGAQGRLRPRRAAPPQHGAGRRHADDQRLRLPGRQRRLRRDAGRRRWPAPISRASPARRAAERGSAAGCAAWVSPITSRARAARRRRMSISASSATARCR